jgi:hypothetical protein
METDSDGAHRRAGLKDRFGKRTFGWASRLQPSTIRWKWNRHLFRQGKIFWDDEAVKPRIKRALFRLQPTQISNASRYLGGERNSGPRPRAAPCGVAFVDWHQINPFQNRSRDWGSDSEALVRLRPLEVPSANPALTSSQKHGCPTARTLIWRSGQTPCPAICRKPTCH